MPYHIDTDMGVDDGLALLVADRMLAGVHALSTVFGNIPVTGATANALLFRALLGKEQDWAVMSGAAHASDGFSRDARHVHGADGLGGATAALDPALLARLAVERVPQIAAAAPARAGKVVLIGLGPATNIPALVRLYGAANVARIVLMSGAFFDAGNITPQAEFNAHCDPHALRETLALGVPATLVPLDLTRKVQLPRPLVAGFGDVDASPVARLISASHGPYMRFCRESEGIDGCIPHDALTVLAALAPDRFQGIRGAVHVDCSQQARGATRVLPGQSHVTVLLGGMLKWARETLTDLLGAAG